MRYGKQIQYDFKGQKVTAEDKAKADQIKHAMIRTFWKYKLAAWGFDEIKPISGDGKTTRWGDSKSLRVLVSLLGMISLWK